MTGEVLHVRDLRVHYPTARGTIRAVDGVSFVLREGERLGLVGESGSGKTTAALAMLQLTRPPASIEGGSVMFEGADLLRLPEPELQRLRFARISLVPQGAMNSLNPVMRIAEQMADVIRAHEKGTGRSEVARRVDELLEGVGLSKAVATMYPHQLSGGMKQRVCIAMAIALRPKVIIADEPTSALDVVTQRQVMETLAGAQEALGASVILVGHDMGLMAQFVDTIGVMYAGRLVEIGPVRNVFAEPLHPYTHLLIASLPTLERKGAFQVGPGATPGAQATLSGCSFHRRCPRAMAACAVQPPGLDPQPGGRAVACHLY